MQQQHEEEGSNRAQQQPRNARARSAGKKRPWYGLPLDCLHLWMQPAVVPSPPAPPAAKEEGSPRWRRCSSAKAAALAFARRLCICAPARSHEAVLRLGVHVDAAAPAPRRSGSYSAGGISHAAAVPALTRPSVAPAWEGTARSMAALRGRSLTDGGPMRRFVLDELTARRREETEEAVHVKRRRWKEKWRPPGNSRLRRMSLPEDRQR